MAQCLLQFEADAEAEADDCGHVVPLGGICEPVIGVPLCRSAGVPGSPVELW